MVPWAEAPPGEALRNAFRLAKFLDCPQAPSERMLDCLRTKDSYEIIDTEFRFYVRIFSLSVLFVGMKILPGNIRHSYHNVLLKSWDRISFIK